MTMHTTLIAIAIVHALVKHVSAQTCALASEIAREDVKNALASAFYVDEGSTWMFDFDQLPADCTDCGNANPASTYGCPRFSVSRVRRRSRRTRGDDEDAPRRVVRASATEPEYHTLPVLDSPNIEFAEGSSPGAQRDGVLPQTCEWTLEPTEVVLIYGCTPSALAYFGITPYWYRLGGATSSLVFASLSDTFSMGENGDFGAFTRLSTEAATVSPGTFIRAPTAPWNSSFSFIMSRNRAALSLAAAVLRDRGLVVNEVGVPPPPSADSTYTVLYRGALPASSEAWKNWVKAPPITTLRLKPKSAAAPEAIFEAAAPLIARRTVDELSLTQAYDALVSAVRERVASVPGRDAAVAATVRPQIVIDSSMTCVNFRINCGGDNRDTNYIRAPAFTLASNDDLVYAIGVRHVWTRNAYYHSVALYNRARRLAVVSIEDAVFKNSAAPWSTSDAFYVVAFARDCSRHDVPIGVPCVDVPQNGFPSASRDESIELWERPYSTYSTTIGPWWQSMILPTLVRSIPAPPPSSSNPFSALFASF